METGAREKDILLLQSMMERVVQLKFEKIRWGKRCAVRAMLKASSIRSYNNTSHHLFVSALSRSWMGATMGLQSHPVTSRW
jgi:hypothetical protein